MSYQEKRKRQMRIIRVVAFVIAVLIIGSVVTAAVLS